MHSVDDQANQEHRYYIAESQIILRFFFLKYSQDRNVFQTTVADLNKIYYLPRKGKFVPAL
jgi:hypothetical protein